MATLTCASELHYTTARGYGNTTKFINYRTFSSIEKGTLNQRLDMVERILDRLNNPMETARADKHERLAYILRSYFLIKTLIPKEAWSEMMLSFLDEFESTDIVEAGDAFLAPPGLKEALFNYSFAIDFAENKQQGYGDSFDLAEKLFGDYRHRKWLAAQ